MTKTRHILRLLIILFFCAIPAYGQSTTVNGTITDANAQAFANGTYSIAFYSNGLGPTFMWNGAPFSPTTTYSGSLDSSGAFSGVSVPSSNAISPTGTGWTFTVCSAASAPCYSQVVLVTGTTLDVSSIITPPAISVNASQTNQFTAYQDSEVSSNRKGTVYFNLTDNTLHACVGLPCSAHWQSIQYSGAAVNSFNGRSGVVVPATNDYALGQINATYGPLLTLSINTLDFTTQTGNCVIASPSNGSTGTPTCRPLVSADLPSSITSNTSGNAATATFATNALSSTSSLTSGAFTSTPTNCGAGIAAIGILSNGNATGCFSPAGILSVTTKQLSADVGPFSSLTTVQGPDNLTMPSSGCPCRVRISYKYFWKSISSAGSVDSLDSYVNLFDGTTNTPYAPDQAASGLVANNTNGSLSGQQTTASFANSQTITLTVKAQASASVTIKKLATPISSLNSYVEYAVVTSQ